MLSAVKYSSIESIIREWEQNIPFMPSGTSNTLTVNPVGWSGGGRGDAKRWQLLRRRRAIEEIPDAKKTNPCTYYRHNGFTKYGHRSPDNNYDVSHKPGTISPDTTVSNPPYNSTETSCARNNTSSGVALGFTSTMIIDIHLHCNISSAIKFDVKHDPLVEDGAK